MAVHAITQFIHLIATAAWIGGMLFMKLVLSPSLSAIDPPQQGRLFGAIAKRFTILSWTCVLLLVVTGLMKTPSGMLFDTSPGYGRMLFVKHLLVLGMIIGGLLITFVAAPRMRALAPREGEKPSPEFFAAGKQIEILSTINTVLGIVVLFAIARF